MIKLDFLVPSSVITQQILSYLQRSKLNGTTLAMSFVSSLDRIGLVSDADRLKLEQCLTSYLLAERKEDREKMKDSMQNAFEVTILHTRNSGRMVRLTQSLDHQREFRKWDLDFKSEEWLKEDGQTINTLLELKEELKERQITAAMQAATLREEQDQRAEMISGQSSRDVSAPSSHEGGDPSRRSTVRGWLKKRFGESSR